MPVALLEPRVTEEELLHAFRFKSGTLVITIYHPDVEENLREILGPGADYEGTTYEQMKGDPAFCWSYFHQSAAWLHEAERDVEPGETQRIRGKVVTRLTDDEIRALEPFKMTIHRW